MYVLNNLSCKYWTNCQKGHAIFFFSLSFLPLAMAPYKKGLSKFELAVMLYNSPEIFDLYIN